MFNTEVSYQYKTQCVWVFMCVPCVDNFEIFEVWECVVSRGKSVISMGVILMLYIFGSSILVMYFEE